jgi:hypothetical protein
MGGVVGVTITLNDRFVAWWQLLHLALKTKSYA